MIKRIFSGQINSVGAAALLVATSSLVSRFLGIFRDRILASEFGASETLDIYYAAFRVPDLIFNLLVLGALSAGFIPLFTKLIHGTKIKNLFSKDQEPAWEFASNLLNLLLVIIFMLISLGIIFAPQLVKIIAPGFNPEQQILTAKLTRIMFLSPLFLGISSILGGILQSFKRFFVYSLSPIMYNIGIIIGALYFVPRWGIEGLAWGVVLGAFLHMLIQIPILFKLGFKYIPKINLKDPNIKKLATMMVPRTLALGVAQINLLIITIIASTLDSGSLTVFNFANNLQAFPIGIFGISFAIAAFPAMSAVAFDKKRLKESFSKTFRQILFFVMPATVILLALRAQIIRVILGTGQFNWQDTVLTIDTLGFFTISIFAQATIPLLIRVFYARHNTKTPFLTGLFSVVVNIGLSYHLSRIYGVAGLALGFSISNIINFIILWMMVKIELGNLNEIQILKSAVKFTSASIMCGIAIQGMKLFVWPYVDMTKLWGVLTQGFFAGLSGALVYVAFCSLFKTEELFHFWGSIKQRLPWAKVEAGDQGEARGI